MKITIDIPKEFEQHFNEDKFKDSLLRLETDIRYDLRHDNTISGLYEIELLDMLVEAFEKAEILTESKNDDLRPMNSSYHSLYETESKNKTYLSKPYTYTPYARLWED